MPVEPPLSPVEAHFRVAPLELRVDVESVEAAHQGVQARVVVHRDVDHGVAVCAQAAVRVRPRVVLVDQGVPQVGAVDEA